MITFGISGRADQGVDQATKLLGRCLFLSKFSVQEFVKKDGIHELGVVKSDKSPIISKQVPNYDILLMIDVSDSAVLKSLNDSGSVIFNSAKKIDNASLKKRKIKSYHIDTSNIKKNVSIVMIGALAKIGKLSLVKVKKAAEEEFDTNRDMFAALEEGYKNVKHG